MFTFSVSFVKGFAIHISRGYVYPQSCAVTLATVTMYINMLSDWSNSQKVCAKHCLIATRTDA